MIKSLQRAIDSHEMCSKQLFEKYILVQAEKEKLECEISAKDKQLTDQLEVAKEANESFTSKAEESKTQNDVLQQRITVLESERDELKVNLRKVTASH